MKSVLCVSLLPCRQADARERVSKGGLAVRSPADKRDYLRCCRPPVSRSPKDAD